MSFLMLALCGEIVAQNQILRLDQSTAGRVYYIAFPDTTNNTVDPKYPINGTENEASVWLFSDVANHVVISSKGQQIDAVDLEPGVMKVYTFRQSAVVTDINQSSSPVFRVEAAKPVVLYAYLATKQGLEAWTPIPVEMWGTRYYAAATPWQYVQDYDAKVGIPKPAPSEILIIAAHDSTQVSIVRAAGGDLYGNPTVVTLNQGEAFQVQSGDDSLHRDIAATIIQSSRPVGVISGNTRASFGSDHAIRDNAQKGMLMEWLTPVDQHGKEFVYLPTTDEHTYSAPVPRVNEYVRVYNTSGNQINGTIKDNSAGPAAFTVKRDSLQEFRLFTSFALRITTQAPAQVMMHSSDVVNLHATLQIGNGGLAYDYYQWAPYMAELTPREQWTRFAPYYAPTNPSTMQHYIGVVADTVTARGVVMEDGTAFPFSHRINGTDLIWGSAPVQPGRTHWLASTSGGKFTGVVYGLMRGEEYYYAEGNYYVETEALSYGYPLSPHRNVLAPHDSLRVDSTRSGCSQITYNVRAVNSSPVGLRFAELDTSSVNARLVRIDPLSAEDVLGRSSVTLKVMAVDSTRPIHARLVFTDRTGASSAVTFDARPDSIAFNPSSALLFGSTDVGSVVHREVTITNTLARTVVISHVDVKGDTGVFSVVSSIPRLPATLKPGEDLTVTVAMNAKEERYYYDTLLVPIECSTMSLPMNGGVKITSIQTGDVDFGVKAHVSTTTEYMEITNAGTLPLTFSNPGDPAHPITWPDAVNFSIAQAWQDSVRNLVLAPKTTFRVPVNFIPTVPGTYRTVARIWASTRDLRDTSVWTGVLRDSTTGVRGTCAEPGVSSGRLSAWTEGSILDVRYDGVATGPLRIELYNALGQQLRAAVADAVGTERYEVQWDLTGLPSGRYYCRVLDGPYTVVQPIPVSW
ncbi:MAG: choice-of-anchor D domain-containing protein [Bacteroidetes bacterium]|nr:choice-of-anchor D domain-containing protein [Bacteroidota bacterium]